jgi:hypothetical protein
LSSGNKKAHQHEPRLEPSGWQAFDPQAERANSAGSKGSVRPQADGDNYQGIAGRQINIVHLVLGVKSKLTLLENIDRKQSSESRNYNNYAQR